MTYISYKQTVHPSDFENKTKAETTERSIKQQEFTLRNSGVHSLLERGVNYLLTGIMKTLVLHGKDKFCDKPKRVLSLSDVA